MIYIFTALYCEAQIFIKRFRLAKSQDRTWFQEFYNETAGIRLTVTGVGEVAAATAVGSICSVYRPTPADLLLNVGICAHTTKNDGIYLCNKIIEQATGKTFYPDMLYRHDLDEGTIVTGMLPWDGDDPVPAGDLYDMEAAAVYQAGSHFFGPHQMVFLKIVSDRGSVEEVTKEQTVHLMEKYQTLIFDHIRQISAMLQKDGCRGKHMCQEEERLIAAFCADLHCSKTMRDSMEQYIWYLSLAGIDYVSVIQDLYGKGLLPCKDKREGKLRFEEFKRRFF